MNVSVIGSQTEHFDKGEPLGLRVETYQFVAADHPADELAVRSFDSALDDHEVEVVHVGLGDVDRVPAETLDEFFHRCCMERAHHRVTGLHRTERDAPLDTPDLSDKDLVGALTQGSLEQVEHGHFPACAEPPVPSPLPFASATSRIQFRCGTFSSGVSSMVTILFSGGINS